MSTLDATNSAACARHTIVALASGSGRAGVAVIRVSGAAASHIPAWLDAPACPVPRHATLASLCHPETGNLIDRALLLYFPAPNSFTGEDVLEIQCHGSHAVIRALLEAISQHPNCRMALAGEFSKRALLHGKMNLLEVEGLADLIDAQTAAQHRQALSVMQGSVAQNYESLRADIVYAMAMMEAYIDFPDEEIPESVVEEARHHIHSICARITGLLADGRQAQMVRDGVRVVIIGAPNAGKSSLLNTLAKQDVAIISDQAGTTRDSIDIHLELGGFAVTLTDTAGLRETDEFIEQEGIRRTHIKASQADIKLALFDVISYPKLDSQTLNLIDENTVVIFTKCDQISSDIKPEMIADYTPLSISIHQPETIQTLIGTLTQTIIQRIRPSESPMITRERHRESLEQSLFHLKRYLDVPLELELQAEELRLAAHTIAKITGQILVDDILDVVFSRFCIGK